MYQVWKEGRTDGSITISLRNFVGEGIIMASISVHITRPHLSNPTFRIIKIADSCV